MGLENTTTLLEGPKDLAKQQAQNTKNRFLQIQNDYPEGDNKTKALGDCVAILKSLVGESEGSLSPSELFENFKGAEDVMTAVTLGKYDSDEIARIKAEAKENNKDIATYCLECYEINNSKQEEITLKEKVLMKKNFFAKMEDSMQLEDGKEKELPLNTKKRNLIIRVANAYLQYAKAYLGESEYNKLRGTPSAPGELKKAYTYMIDTSNYDTNNADRKMAIENFFTLGKRTEDRSRSSALSISAKLNAMMNITDETTFNDKQAGIISSIALSIRNIDSTDSRSRFFNRRESGKTIEGLVMPDIVPNTTNNGSIGSDIDGGEKLSYDLAEIQKRQDNLYDRVKTNSNWIEEFSQLVRKSRPIVIETKGKEGTTNYKTTWYC